MRVSLLLAEEAAAQGWMRKGTASSTRNALTNVNHLSAMTRKPRAELGALREACSRGTGRRAQSEAASERSSQVVAS